MGSSISALPARAWGRARRTTRRAAKYAGQLGTGRRGRAAPVFVLGCQRSGTNMLLAVLEASPETWTYNEDNPRAFRRFRLRDLERISWLTERARCRSVAFKALCDSQHADRLLERFPQGRVVWLLRDCAPVADSAVRKWGDGQLRLVRRIAGDAPFDHWLAERVPEPRRELVRELVARDLSLHSAAALKWYLRNELYFDRELDRVPDRAMLVRYEDVVADPEARFAEVFRFAGLGFDPAFVREVSGDRRGPEPDIDPEVRELCDDLAARLDRVLQDQRARSGAR
ncbi:MAG: sulfotransferase [Actinomycetota bacterium]|nr:sulfotransferase [Actinomycetota bacterium]